MQGASALKIPDSLGHTNCYCTFFSKHLINTKILNDSFIILNNSYTSHLIGELDQFRFCGESCFWGPQNQVFTRTNCQSVGSSK